MLKLEFCAFKNGKIISDECASTNIFDSFLWHYCTYMQYFY